MASASGEQSFRTIPASTLYDALHDNLACRPVGIQEGNVTVWVTQNWWPVTVTAPKGRLIRQPGARQVPMLGGDGWYEIEYARGLYRKIQAFTKRQNNGPLAPPEHKPSPVTNGGLAARHHMTAKKAK
jgi:hypothetical protein